MKPNRSPFYWIIRNRTFGTALSRAGKVQRFTSARAAAAECGVMERAVRVCARIPEPKLPAWVTALSFQYRHVQVWRQHRPGAWTQYVFYVSTAADLSVKEAVVHPHGAAPWGASDVVSAPVDVWAEAAQRAAKMLRARKAAR